MPAALLALGALGVLILAALKMRTPEPGQEQEQAQASGPAGVIESARQAVTDAADAVSTAAGAVFSSGQAVLDQAGAVVRKLWELPARAAPYADAIAQAERKYDLPAGLLGRVLYQESRFRPDIINGGPNHAGAVGIAQIIPRWHPTVNPRDPFASIDYAAKYLRENYARFGDWRLALAAYNWGPGNQSKDLRDQVAGNEWPQETRDYVEQISRDVDLGA